MVIQNNEQEFKGKTLQEYLNWKYPTKEDKERVREISSLDINKARKEVGIEEELAGGELDLKEFINLNTLGCTYNLTSIDVSGLTNLNTLYCNCNNLTSLNVSGCANLNTLECS